MKEKSHVIIEVVPGKGTHVIKTRYTETDAEIKYEWHPMPDMKLERALDEAFYRPPKKAVEQEPEIRDNNLFAIGGGVRLSLYTGGMRLEP